MYNARAVSTFSSTTCDRLAEVFSVKLTINKRADSAWHDAHFNEFSRISLYAYYLLLKNLVTYNFHLTIKFLAFDLISKRNKFTFKA